MLKAGPLRHRVTIQVREDTTTGGRVETTWAPVYANVPARVKPSSVRALIASAQAQQEISAQITIRTIPGFAVTNRHRFVHGSDVYNPVAPLADDNSGEEYWTIPCSTGVNEGDE